MVTDRKTSEGQDTQQNLRRLRNLAAAGVVYILFGLILWWILDLYIAPDSSTEKKDLIQALALILAGAAGAIGIYFTWRGQLLTQQSLQDSREGTAETLNITRQANLTDRFTKAVELLGKTENGEQRLESRLGGIYALERIAKDSRSYHWPVMEVLTTYVRMHARRKPAEESSEGKFSPLRLDITAVLTVLRRRESEHREQESGPIDLRSTNLQGANLRKVDLRGAILAATDLSRADLREADLREATLPLTLLEGARLEGAKVQGANLRMTRGLKQIQIMRANGDKKTILPKGLSRPKKWEEQSP